MNIDDLKDFLNGLLEKYDKEPPTPLVLHQDMLEYNKIRHVYGLGDVSLDYLSFFNKLEVKE